MLKAKDIMTAEVVTVTPQTSVEDLAKILMEKRISGVPVVDDTGALVGIVTENDLIRKEKRLHIPTVFRILDAVVYLEGVKQFDQDLKRMVAGKVGDICAQDVITVDEETTVTEIATIMSEKGVHLIPVVRDGRLVGIIGKLDVVRAISMK